jgi:hypothetical protein
MDHLTVDLSGLGQIDVAQQGTRITKPVAPKPVMGMERSALDAAISKAPGNVGSLLRDIRGLATAGTPITTSFVGSAAGFTVPASKGLDITVGVGAAVDFSFIIFYCNFGRGLYASTTKEVGWYDAQAAGFGTPNLSASLNLPVITIIFGPPSDFGGLAAAVTVDYSFAPPSKFGVTGSLLFSASPVRLVGLSFAGTYGLSAVPMDIAITSAPTQLHQFK